MNEQECLVKMVAPGTRRPGKYREGVIQVHVTRACNRACFNCTQGSNLGGKTHFMSPEQYEQALLSLKGYWGVVGMFGGNPCTHPQFHTLCEILRSHFPLDQRGLWSNDPITLENARVCARTFSSRHSNLNVHMDRTAYVLFKAGWPECGPVGLTQDSRHGPVHLAMKDVLRKECGACDGAGTLTLSDLSFGSSTEGMSREEITRQDNETRQPCTTCNGTGQVYNEPRAWELIADCDINKHWSAMIGVFRGGLRAWFCEVAGAQAMLHQDEPDYPDTGVPLPFDWWEGPAGAASRTPFAGAEKRVWWQLRMADFTDQVRKHCHECAVPLRGYGELACAPDDTGTEQTSATHAGVYKPKRRGRQVEVVTNYLQLGVGRIAKSTAYLQNATGKP